MNTQIDRSPLILLLKRIYREFPGDFLVVMTMLSLLRAQVQFLVRELRFHKSPSVAKTTMTAMTEPFTAVPDA